ncbi:MAG: amidohydrolase family protein [Planctomycetota bacterium]
MLRLSFFVFFYVAMIPYFSVRAQASEYVALIGADIYPVSAPLIRQGVLILKKGRIQALGTHLPIPENATIYQLSGKRVYPGLILSNFVFAVSPQGQLEENLDPYQDWVEFLLSVGVTNVHTAIHRGNQDFGPYTTTAILNLNPLQSDQWILAQNVSIYLDSFFRSPSGLFDLRQKLQQARKQIQANPKLQQSNDPYIRLILKQVPARVHLDSRDQLEQLIRLVRETSIQVVVEGAEEGWIVASDLAREGIAGVLFTRQVRQPYDPATLPVGASLRNAFLCARAGFCFALSVPGASIIRPGGTLNQDVLTFHLEPAFAIREGLSEDIALRSITSDAAKIIGLEHEIGSIRPGLRANLAVFDGDIFHYASFCTMTFVDGQLIYEKSTSSLYSKIPPKSN